MLEPWPFLHLLVGKSVQWTIGQRLDNDRTTIGQRLDGPEDLIAGPFDHSLLTSQSICHVKLRRRAAQVPVARYRGCWGRSEVVNPTSA